MPNLKLFYCYMYISTFKVLNVRHLWQYIQHGDYAFFIDLKDAYLHIHIAKHHCHFFMICLSKYIIAVESFPFMAGYGP